MKTVTRPTVRWHGGKWLLAPWIISYFPKHRVYTEVYGGAGSVLMQKPRVYAEIYNDLDGNVVNLFKILRDPVQAAELKRRLELTPFARKEFEESIFLKGDPIEEARGMVIRGFMGFGSNSHNYNKPTGFRANSNRSGTTPAQDWINYPRGIDAMVERLKGVIIECREATDILCQHDGLETLHYVDPPYVHSTRASIDRDHRRMPYTHEMTDEQHKQLAAVLKDLEGMVILSGYDCPLYKTLYSQWKTETKKAFADGARSRVETLWFNNAAWEKRPQEVLPLDGKGS
jgi:DNA adenine methylase